MYMVYGQTLRQFFFDSFTHPLMHSSLLLPCTYIHTTSCKFTHCSDSIAHHSLQHGFQSFRNASLWYGCAVVSGVFAHPSP